MKVLENSPKLAQIQSRLNKYAYLSKNSLPGYADGRVFQLLQSLKRFPDRSNNPHFYHWYILMKQFSPLTISKWVVDQLYFESDDSLILEFVRMFSKKQQGESIEEARPRVQNANQFEYTVDIYMNDWIEEKIKTLEKILEEYGAETIEIDEKEKPKFIRVVCRMEASRSQEMVNKISACIQFANIQIKKRSMKGSASITVQKNVVEN